MIMNDNSLSHFRKRVFSLLDDASDRYPTLKVDADPYKKAMELSKLVCRKLTPALYEGLFENDMDLVFEDGSKFNYCLYYYNPDSNCGGQIVQCPFDAEQAAQMVDNEDYMDVLATNTQYLADIDSYHFFETLFDLMEDYLNGKCLGDDRDKCFRTIVESVAA